MFSCCLLWGWFWGEVAKPTIANREIHLTEGLQWKSSITKRNQKPKNTAVQIVFHFPHSVLIVSFNFLSWILVSICEKHPMTDNYWFEQFTPFSLACPCRVLNWWALVWKPSDRWFTAQTQFDRQERREPLLTSLPALSSSGSSPCLPAVRIRPPRLRREARCHGHDEIRPGDAALPLLRLSALGLDAGLPPHDQQPQPAACRTSAGSPSSGHELPTTTERQPANTLNSICGSYSLVVVQS